MSDNTNKPGEKPIKPGPQVEVDPHTGKPTKPGNVVVMPPGVAPLPPTKKPGHEWEPIKKK
jgi:hypothetical protein